MSHLLRLTVVVLLATMLTLVPRASTFAGSTVDPSTLNPPPTDFLPPGTQVTCELDAGNIICRATFASSFSGNIGPVCAGTNPSFTFDVMLDARSTDDVTFRYNTSGSLVEATDHSVFAVRNTNAATGVFAINSGGLTLTVTLTTPGDISTATFRFAGLFGKWVVQGSGQVAHDVGLAIFPPVGPAIFHGPHDFLQLGQDVFGNMCNAIAA